MITSWQTRLFGLFAVTLLLLACGISGTATSPGAVEAAGAEAPIVTQPAPTAAATVAPLPTLMNTPAAGNEVEPAGFTANGPAEDAEVDQALQEVIDRVCAEIRAAEAELGDRDATGQELAELQAALAELAIEIEDCPPTE
ncbi:MAG: hypothetical protein KDE34_02935 [Anaerolineales bacterium]|nr:hypothetical protein [Anaerolineales bacterium]MCB8960615.1 hypothetical protein [Ardenticatenales bacterium]